MRRGFLIHRTGEIAPILLHGFASDTTRRHVLFAVVMLVVLLHLTLLGERYSNRTHATDAD